MVWLGLQLILHWQLAEGKRVLWAMQMAGLAKMLQQMGESWHAAAVPGTTCSRRRECRTASASMPTFAKALVQLEDFHPAALAPYCCRRMLLLNSDPCFRHELKDRQHGHSRPQVRLHSHAEQRVQLQQAQLPSQAAPPPSFPHRPVMQSQVACAGRVGLLASAMLSNGEIVWIGINCLSRLPPSSLPMHISSETDRAMAGS